MTFITKKVKIKDRDPSWVPWIRDQWFAAGDVSFLSSFRAEREGDKRLWIKMAQNGTGDLRFVHPCRESEGGEGREEEGTRTSSIARDFIKIRAIGMKIPPAADKKFSRNLRWRRMKGFIFWPGRGSALKWISNFNGSFLTISTLLLWLKYFLSYEL